MTRCTRGQRIMSLAFGSPVVRGLGWQTSALSSRRGRLPVTVAYGPLLAPAIHVRAVLGGLAGRCLSACYVPEPVTLVVTCGGLPLEMIVPEPGTAASRLVVAVTWMSR
jgi:hypothetical protein